MAIDGSRVTVLTGGGLMVDVREDEAAVRGLNIIEYVDVPQNNAKADLVIGYAFLDRVHIQCAMGKHILPYHLLIL